MIQPAQSKEDILKTLRENRRQFERLGVHRLGIFGSFVRGEQKTDSDIDLLVEFKPGEKTFDNFMDLSSQLEILLQRRIELVTAESLSPHIGPKILKEVEYVTLSS